MKVHRTALFQILRTIANLFFFLIKIFLSFTATGIVLKTINNSWLWEQVSYSVYVIVSVFFCSSFRKITKIKTAVVDTLKDDLFVATSVKKLNIQTNSYEFRPLLKCWAKLHCRPSKAMGEGLLVRKALVFCLIDGKLLQDEAQTLSKR